MAEKLYADLFDVKNKAVIVTGAARGIGASIAEMFAKANARIAIVDIANAEESAEKLRRSGYEAIGVPTDISSLESVKSMAEKVVKAFGRIDVLVNNAAVNVRKPIVEMSKEEVELQININLKGLYFCSQAVGQWMIKFGGGKIVNIASTGAARALEDLSVYCGTKGGVSQVTKVFALEWGKYNINVNAVGPGPVPTAMSDPARFDAFLRRMALKRLGKPEDIAAMVLVLASKASEYVTGQTIYVDGGWTIF